MIEVLQTRLDRLCPEQHVLMQRAPILGSAFLDAAINSTEKAQDGQLFIKCAQLIGENL